MVSIPAGATIQTYVDANPTNTAFELSAGTYSAQEVWPKTGNTFTGAANLATIMDGGGGSTERHAFNAYSSTNNVVIDGILIRNYVDSSNPNLFKGVVSVSTPNGNSGWIIRNCEIGPNVGAGLTVFGGLLVQHNKIHDNTLLGIKGYPVATGITINNNDIYDNNTDQASPYGETGFASGMKLFDVSYVTISNNRIHGNYGAGLWFDTNFHHITVTNNEFYGQLRDTAHTNQAGIGLFFEIGLMNAGVLNNVVSGNYIHNENVGLFISTSNNIEIFDNAFDANTVATIRAFTEDRSTDKNGVPFRTQDLSIHDNWFAYSQGVVSQRDADVAFKWYDQNITYEYNTYFVNPSQPFAYQGARYVDNNGTLITPTTWRNLPSNPDATSVFRCGHTSLPEGLGPRGGYTG